MPSDLGDNPLSAISNLGSLLRNIRATNGNAINYNGYIKNEKTVALSFTVLLLIAYNGTTNS